MTDREFKIRERLRHAMQRRDEAGITYAERHWPCDLDALASADDEVRAVKAELYRYLNPAEPSHA